MQAQIESIEADIASLPIDAIVNAANEPLIMGGGVDGAIRLRAGPQMEDELRRIGRCPTGQAIITRGYRLPARFVIHTVAPVWSSPAERAEKKERLLAECYRNAMKLADRNAIASLAFPCIGTGIYSWPPDRAASIAFRSVTSHLETTGTPLRILFCCYSHADKLRYEKLIGAL